ncbi:hypothetical protein WHI96_27190 [Pseudonocardia tropica]|uniref:Uncharacterized protein n=1 Tax=Pseudonocardia tropica TaxID=681289 RepID=A0ABV1K2N4_9PSEU
MRVEPVRAPPLDPLGVLRVARVGKRVEELRKLNTRPTFSGTLPDLDTTRIVAEVMDITGVITGADDSEQLRPGPVGDAGVDVRIAEPITSTVDLELVQVGVGPAHRFLHHARLLTPAPSPAA